MIRELARFEKIFLAIHAFGLRCFKVLDKVRGLANLSIKATALIMITFKVISKLARLKKMFLAIHARFSNHVM